MVKSAIGYPRDCCSAVPMWRASGRRATVLIKGIDEIIIPLKLYTGDRPVLPHLVSDAGESVPITPVAADERGRWSAALEEAGRGWVAATGFTGEGGKAALLPDGTGGLARVLVGVAPGETLWALAGLPDTLPEGSYRLDPEPDARAAGRMALGWALACYAFARYKAPPRGFAKLVWPKSADRGLVERLARGIGLARDLINTPAQPMGPAEPPGAAEGLAGRHSARFSAIVGDALLAENHPVIHAVGRARPRAPPPAH